MRRSTLLVGFCVLAWPCGTASAGEFCVSCTGPEAVYRCTIEGAPDRPTNDPRAQLLCISELARSGGHETCSVMRNPVEPCAGSLRIVAAPPAAEIPPPPPAEDAAAAPLAPPQASGETEVEKQAPPRTVEELAGQTIKSSQEGLKKTGEAIGGGAKSAGEQIGNAGGAVANAAKKTWNCLTSLFSDC